MRKLLWIGDAVVSSGFARCTHHTLKEIYESWDVSVLGLNYNGDPHDYPYRIYPCWPGGDAFGLGRMKNVLEMVKPDLIVIQNDPWNIAQYLRRIPEGIPVVASMPVDGKNCRLGWDLEHLDKVRASAAMPFAKLDHAIFWTKFGMVEARRGGGNQSWGSDVIPLGVDLEIYQPMNRLEARQKLGLPDHMADSFIVGNVNRNQPRKRLDLTLQYFAEWRRRHHAMDAFLFLHVAPTGDAGYDLRQLKKYYDPVAEWLVIVEPELGFGAPEELMPLVYSAFDVQLTTTQGEGWGLTTMEGMACGVPQITPEWSALGEWTESASIGVPCKTTIATPNGINVVGGVPDLEGTVRALDLLYRNESFRGHAHAREYFSMAGLELVQRPEFRWQEISQKFSEALDRVWHQLYPVVPAEESA